MELRTIFILALVFFAEVIGMISANICETEQVWGFQCDGCTKMVNCIKSGKNWIATEIGRCDESKKMYCSKSEKKCSTTKDCENMGPTPQVEFVCQNEGIFPNPYDCKTFYVCKTSGSNIDKDKMKCPDGYAFNPVMNLCNEKASNSELCKKQFVCNATFEMAAWPTNKNIFYVCKEGKVENTDEKYLYPDLYTCEPDQIFDNQTQQCLYEDQIGSTTTNESGIETTTSPPIDKCTKTGIFEDPNNCRGYIYCDKQLQKNVKTCPTNAHFDKTKKSCVLGSDC